ncbi:RagB/SusD family nutrient uptake outer membrane protein [Balneolaceae bacterium ANBcel3]|nr:RagB/SusD family nutrient uptake outer membrane protein [Balneolaceae bacterium ANBcel3]
MSTRKKISGNIFCFTALLLFVTACGDDFFDRPPLDQIVEDNFYQTEQDLAMATAPLYNSAWFDFNDKAKIEVGDARAGNMLTNDPGRMQFVLFSTHSSNERLNEMWRSLYLVITNANLQMNNIAEKASEDIPEMVRLHRIAEARFMRGTAYYYLASLWGDVPIITRTEHVLQNPNQRRNPREDVLNFAIRDLEFAAEHLVLSDADGRVTEWSAKGMLARLYLTRAHFNSNGGALVESDLQKAREHARDVIHSSGARLMDDYADLFMRRNNNNPESLFALQWVFGADEWGTHNSTQAYYAVEARLTGAGDGWGGGTSVSAWLIDLFGGPETEDQRRKATFMLDGDHYPELLQSQGGYTYEGEIAPIKKYVIGTAADNDGNVGFMETDINTYMLRLAEVYLTYAQAILGNNAQTSDSEALYYFNQVRTRAGLDPLSSITYIDIFEEKWKELAYEAQNWYELVRLFNWQPQKAVSIVESQNRNTSFTYTRAGGLEMEDPPSAISPNESDFRLQYPEAEVTVNPYFLDPPEPYEFD